MTHSPKQLPDACDVVIIGSGMGGLTAGAILSKAGLNTVILESDHQPGGYLAGFRRKGFKFETAIHWLTQCDPGGFVRNIFDYIGEGMPDCPPLKRIHRFKGEGYDYTLTSNPLEFRDTLIADFPEDEDGIHRFFDDAQFLGKKLDVLNHRIRSKETMSPLEQAVFGIKMLFWVIPVLKFLRPPVDDALDRYFTSPKLKNVFCTQERFMSIMVPIAWAFGEDFQSAPTGGGAALVNWLCKKNSENGAGLHLRSRVKQVVLDSENSVRAVVCENGHEISCDYVIAACDIQTLYEKMLPPDAVPQPVKDAVNNAELHESCFVVFLGLDCPPEQLGFGEEILNLAATTENREDHTSGDPHKSILMIVASSVRDPSLAPDGQGSMMILCPAYMDYKDDWGTGSGRTRGEDYRNIKAEYADVIMERVEAIAPGLKDHTVLMETASPVTFWRYTNNTDGTILGTKPNGKNIRANASHYRTPVKNLFMGGHCAEYGGGVPIAVKAGANSSLLVLKSMNHPDFNTLKDVL